MSRRCPTVRSLCRPGDRGIATPGPHCPGRSHECRPSVPAPGWSLVRLAAGMVIVTYVTVAMLGTLQIGPRGLLVSIPLLRALGAVPAHAGHQFSDPYRALRH